MHFCALAARRYSRDSRPRNTSLNWFIPAFVKSSVASPAGTSGELGTTLWPFASKYVRKEPRSSLEVIRLLYRTSLQHPYDLVGFESLVQEISIQAGELRVV